MRKFRKGWDLARLAPLVFAVGLVACASGDTDSDTQSSETNTADTKKASAKTPAAPAKKRGAAKRTKAQSKKVKANLAQGGGPAELKAARRSKTGRKASAVVKAAVARTRPGSDEMRRLEGTWRRTTTKTARYWAFWTEGESLHGVLLNPPFDTMTCEFAGTLTSGGQLKGVVTWTEGEYTMRTAWELDVEAFDRLDGRVEEADWEEGKVYSREWVSSTLVKVDYRR